MRLKEEASTFAFALLLNNKVAGFKAAIALFSGFCLWHHNHNHNIKRRQSTQPHTRKSRNHPFPWIGNSETWNKGPNFCSLRLPQNPEIAKWAVLFWRTPSPPRFPISWCRGISCWQTVPLTQSKFLLFSVTKCSPNLIFDYQVSWGKPENIKPPHHCFLHRFVLLLLHQLRLLLQHPPPRLVL